MGDTMNCSMSCCQGSENPLITAVAFVLQEMNSGTASMPVTGVADALQIVEIRHLVQPLSPPPRSARAS